MKMDMEQATQYRMPISICISVGSNSGEHDGFGSLEQYINDLANRRGVMISVAAGNEGNARLHYKGKIKKEQEYQVVEFQVSENSKGFIMELWGDAPNTYTIGFDTPQGGYVERIPPKYINRQQVDFLFEKTKITVDSILVEELSGKQLIFIRFVDPSPGLWRMRVYTSGSAQGEYNIWMPIQNFIGDGTYFLEASPDITLTNSSNARRSITVGAYNHLNNSIYLDTGRGYTSSGDIKPDLVAPGVDVYGPAPGNRYVRRSGTSIAATHVCGAFAQIYEWAIKRGNETSVNGIQIKRYLIRGAQRKPILEYPNRQWGDCVKLVLG